MTNSLLILDTNIVSYLFKAHAYAELYDEKLQGKKLAVSFVTIGEMLYGAYHANWGEKRIKSLDIFLHRFLLLHYSHFICECWAKIRQQRCHQPISENDAWIAATALAYQVPLVTHNSRDFHGIDNLSLITMNN